MTQLKSKIVISLLALSLLFVGADFVLAEDAAPATNSVQLGKIFYLSDTVSQTQFENAGSFVEKLIDLLIKLVGTVALIFLVIGGFRLVLAAGNDNEIQKAKDMLLYAVIGLVVALTAFILVKLVQSLLLAVG